MAQLVRRAAPLTAELSAQSGKRVSVVCDHLLGFRDEPAKPGNVTSLATSSPFSLPASSSLSASDSSILQQAKDYSTSQKGSVEPSHEQPRVPEVAAVLDETMSCDVKATGKDESSMRRHLAKSRPPENAEEKQRFQDKKKEACEFFRRHRSFKPKTRDELEQEFKRKILSGFYNSSIKEQEKDLQEWTDESAGGRSSKLSSKSHRSAHDSAPFKRSRCSCADDPGTRLTSSEVLSGM